MRKVMVVGLGAQGGPAASILARDANVEQLVLADIDQELAAMVADKIGGTSSIIKPVDARNVDSVAKAGEGVDVIINLTNPIFNRIIMEAALKIGAHYVDTSIGETMSLNLYEEDNILKRMVEGEPLPLEEEFKSAGLTCLMGCGASPGLTNVFARYLADKLDTLDELKIRFVAKPLEEDPVIKGWTPIWSPARALWGYAFKPILFENGAYRQVPIYSGREVYKFDEPLNEMPVAYHQHPEQVTLPYYLKKGIQYCDFKYTIDKECGTLIEMGFAQDAPIEVDGHMVSPRKVLLAMVPPPSNLFLLEDEEMLEINPEYDIDCQAAIELSGHKDDKFIKYRLSFNPLLYSNTQEKRHMYQMHGTFLSYTALPAVVGAALCSEGKAEPGMIGPECIDPLAFLSKTCDYGIDIPVRETRECTLKQLAQN